MTYEAECELGRDYAAQAIEEARATGDLPTLVRSIREMAAGEGGASVGFLYALAEMAAEGRG